MADTQPKKFMFDHAFDGTVGQIAPARDRRPVTLTYEQLEAMKKESHDAGFAAGHKAASEEAMKHLTSVVEKIEASVARLFAEAEAMRPQQETRVREAVYAIARKVLPNFAQQQGMQEIESVVASVINEMHNEPRLVVRVNEGQFDTLNANIKAITEKQAYTGKVVLLADAEIRPGDCRVEWADGGIERNLEALWQSLGKTLAPGQEQAPASSDAAG